MKRLKFFVKDSGGTVLHAPDPNPLITPPICLMRQGITLYHIYNLILVLFYVLRT